MSFPRLSAAGRAYRLGVYLICALLATAPATADTLIVGPKAGELSLADAVKRAQDGDTIAILEGEYDAQVAVIEHKKLTLKGVGKRPVLRAGGRVAEGKAILVIRGEDITVENLEFRGARAPDGNGAGIRFEKGRLLVRRCRFVDNENGILTANFADAELTVEDSRFSDAPDSSRLPHLLYVGTIARFTLSGSHFSHGRHAHLVKSRARESLIRNNQLVDGEGGSAAYELEFPNGGVAEVVGNTIEQSADTTNLVMLSFGAEGERDARTHRLLVENNRFINRAPLPAVFVRVHESRLKSPVTKTLLNNSFVGPGLSEF